MSAVGFFKFALLHAAASCAAADVVVFSEADVVLQRDPLAARLAGGGVAGDFAGDVLVSAHARHPMVNIGLVVLFARRAGGRAAALLAACSAEFLRFFRAGQPARDQEVFDALINNTARFAEWAGEDKAAYPDPAPHLLALAPLPGLRWEMLPPADFVEYSANAACPPVHAGACWGGDTRAAAAVHFTCLDRAVKLRNMAQLYANGTCDVCGKC